MNPHRFPLPILVLASLLSACQTWTRVEVGPVEVADGFTLTTDREWSRWKGKHADLWTIHGGALESLRLTRGLADGDPLVELATTEEAAPVYRSAMSPSEVLEFVEDSLTRVGAVGVESADLRPGPYAGHDGFRFELSFVNESGLRFEGLGAGSKVGGRLYLVLFTAPALHYFPAVAPSVEAMIESATIEAD